MLEIRIGLTIVCCW